MSNWYLNNLYKEANTLAKSLGLSGESYLFQEIQKFETLLKSEGDWMRIINTKKSKGKDAAINQLRNIINGYQLNVENNPPDVSSYKISHLKRTSTGGDWYEFSEKDGGPDVIAFEDWEYNNNYYLEESYLESDNDLILRDLEDRWIEKAEKLDDQEEAYLDKYKNKDKSSNQQSMDFYENPQVIRIKRRYERLKIEAEDKLNVANKDLKRATDLNDLYDIYTEFLGEDDEDAIEDVKMHYRDGYQSYAESSFENEEEYRDESAEEEFSEEIKDYFKLTCGASWCISQPGDHLEEFLKDGYSFLILRRGKEARVAIRYDETGVEEVQGIGNEFDKINGLDTLDLLECPNFTIDALIPGFKDGPNEINEDDRSNILLDKILNIDSEVLMLDSIQSVFNDNIDGLKNILFSNDSSVKDNIQFILSILSDKEVNSFVEEKLLQILDEMLLVSNLDLNKSKMKNWGNEIVEMVQGGNISQKYMAALFNPYANKILPEFFEDIGSNDELKMWAEKEALTCLYSVFGQKALDYASRYGLEKSNNSQMSKDDTIKYISDNLFLIYGSENFKNNPDAVHYVCNTILMSARHVNHLRILNSLYNFVNLVMPEMKKVYDKEIINKIVSLVAAYAKHVNPNSPKMERYEIILFVNSPQILDSELRSLVNSSDMIKSIQEMRKNLDFEGGVDPYAMLLYPDNEGQPMGNEETNQVQSSSVNWYKS